MARKKAISENPNLAPYAAFHRKGKIRESYAEKYFRTVLENNNIEFKQEFQVDKYSLDFLIGNVDLEIDGEQHYTTKKIIDSDIERTSFLTKLGLNVKRVRWSWFMRLNHDEKIKFLNDLTAFLQNQNNETIDFPIILEKTKKVKLENKKIKCFCSICGKPIYDSNKKFCSYDCYFKFKSKNIPSKEDLLEKIKEIGFNKIKLGLFYNVSDNAIKKWLIKYNIPVNKNDFLIWIEQK